MRIGVVFPSLEVTDPGAVRDHAQLGATFPDRGRRIGEQLAVLRALFSQEAVTFSGRWHDLEAWGSRRCRGGRSPSGSAARPMPPCGGWPPWARGGSR